MHVPEVVGQWRHHCFFSHTQPLFPSLRTESVSFFMVCMPSWISDTYVLAAILTVVIPSPPRCLGPGFAPPHTTSWFRLVLSVPSLLCLWFCFSLCYERVQCSQQAWDVFTLLSVSDSLGSEVLHNVPCDSGLSPFVCPGELKVTGRVSITCQTHRDPSVNCGKTAESLSWTKWPCIPGIALQLDGTRFFPCVTLPCLQSVLHMLMCSSGSNRIKKVGTIGEEGTFTLSKTYHFMFLPENL